MKTDSHARVHPRRNTLAFGVVVVLTGLAAVLRITDLNARSMWLDEGFTLLRVFDTWPHLLNNDLFLQGAKTIDPHPPFYFALLKLWGSLFGDNLFALRLFSPACAILMVPITYVVARRFISLRASVLAAAFATLSASYQWYGWEVRMYTFVPLMAGLMFYLLMRVYTARRRTAWWWLAWFLATAAACLSHYTLVSIALLQAVILLARALSYRWRNGLRVLLVGLAAMTGVGVALVLSGGIGGLLQLARSSSSMVQGSFTVVEIKPYLIQMFGGAVFGLNAADPTDGLVLLLVAACCAFSTVQLLKTRNDTHKRILNYLPALTIIVPLLFWIVMSYLIENRPSFRYLIVMVLPMQVLLARLADAAVAALRKPNWAKKWAGALLACILILVTAAQAYGLGHTFVRKPSWQDDWQTLAKVIRENWQPGDAVLLNLYSPEMLVKLYLRGLPVDVLPDFPLKISQTYTSDRARAWITSSYRRIWYVNAGARPIGAGNGADGILVGLHQRNQYVFEGRSNIVALQLFDTNSPILDNLPNNTIPVESPQPTTRIAGYAIQPGSPYHDLPNLRLSIYWRKGIASDDLSQHRVAIRLLYQNQVWLDWLLPAQLQFAPAAWDADQLYRVDYAVPVPLGLPALPYQLQLNVLAGQKSESVQAIKQPTTSQQMSCCLRITSWGNLQPDQIHLSPLSSPVIAFDLINPPIGSLPRQAPRQDIWHSRDVSLVQAEFAEARQPGDILPIVLTWRAQQANLSGWETELRLENFWGTEITTIRRATGTPDFPVTAWPLAEPVRDVLALQVPDTAEPGRYRLSLVRWRHGAKLDSVWLGWVQLLAPQHTPVPQSIPSPIANARIGDATLLGYGSDQPFARGATLAVHTYWRFDAQPTRDGVLSLHVVYPDGSPGPQDDNPPEQGLRSTRSYRSGDGLDQVHRITLKQDAPAGEYKLYALIYDKPEAGAQRWPAQQNNQPAKDDLVYLGSFTLPKLPELAFKHYLPIIAKP